MSGECDWHPYDRGASIGTKGSENGEILLDEEHDGGARITLERGGHSPFSITCGVYGTMVHTRYFSDEQEARSEFQAMKGGLEEMLTHSATDSGAQATYEETTKAAVRFMDRFP